MRDAKGDEFTDRMLGAGLGIRATARHANCSTTTLLRIRDLTV